MTTQEAIRIMTVAIAEVEWCCPMDYAVAFEKAIEALEKQIPKEPIEDGYYNEPCVCPNCGQPLDWSDIK